MYYFVKFTAQYEFACKNYEQLYILLEFYYNRIIKDDENCNGLYVYYYETLLFNNPFIEDKIDFKEPTLLEYLFKNDLIRYEKEIDRLKEIIEKDPKEHENNINYINKLKKFIEKY